MNIQKRQYEVSIGDYVYDGELTVANLKSLIAEIGDVIQDTDKVRVEEDEYNDGSIKTVVEIIRVEEEDDDEYQTRVLQIEARQKAARDYKRALYEKLKEEFDEQ